MVVNQRETQMTEEVKEYQQQVEAGEHLWGALVNGKFNPSFAAMWRPSSVRDILEDEYETFVSDTDAAYLYDVLADMVADIMKNANEMVESRVTEVLSEFANKVGACPPDMGNL